MAIQYIGDKQYGSLSTDDKNTQAYDKGAELFEVDVNTGIIKKYIYINGEWRDDTDIAKISDGSHSLNINPDGSITSVISATPTFQITSMGQLTSDIITRPNNIDAYVALDVVGESPAANLEFANVLSSAGKYFQIVAARMRIDVSAIPSGMTSFRLHLYNAAPTPIADNSAYNLPSGDRDKYLGYITLSVVQDLGDTLYIQEDSLSFISKLADNSTTLYGILQTIGGYTPTASVVKSISLVAIGV